MFFIRQYIAPVVVWLACISIAIQPVLALPCPCVQGENRSMECGKISNAHQTHGCVCCREMRKDSVSSNTAQGCCCCCGTESATSNVSVCTCNEQSVPYQSTPVPTTGNSYGIEKSIQPLGFVTIEDPKSDSAVRIAAWQPQLPCYSAAEYCISLCRLIF